MSILLITHIHTDKHTLYLDANVVYRDDGVLQRGEHGLVYRFSHHHLGRHIDKIHTDGLRHEREGARGTQVTLDHLGTTGTDYPPLKSVEFRVLGPRVKDLQQCDRVILTLTKRFNCESTVQCFTIR